MQLLLDIILLDIDYRASNTVIAIVHHVMCTALFLNEMCRGYVWIGTKSIEYKGEYTGGTRLQWLYTHQCQR